MSRTGALAAGWLVLVAACGADSAPLDDPATVAGEPTGCADVIDVGVTSAADGTLRFDVTVRSADTGWDKYADRWEIRTVGDDVLAVRELTHPHVDEQPFTRSLAGIRLPSSLARVVVSARDSVEGFCGRSLTVELPD